MRDYVLDPYLSIEARRSMRRSLKLEAVEQELAAFSAVSAKRAAEMLDAIDLAIGARATYLRAASGRNKQVSTLAAIEKLAHIVATSSIAKHKLDVNEAAAAALADDLLRCGDFCSFSMFCVLLQRRRATLGKQHAVESRNRTATRVERMRGALFGQRSWFSKLVTGDAPSAPSDPTAPSKMPPRLTRNGSQHFVTPSAEYGDIDEDDEDEARYHEV